MWNNMRKKCINCGKEYGQHFSYQNDIWCLPPNERDKHGIFDKFETKRKKDPIEFELDNLFDDTITELCGEEKKPKAKGKVMPGGWSLGDDLEFDDEEIWTT